VQNRNKDCKRESNSSKQKLRVQKRLKELITDMKSLRNQELKTEIKSSKQNQKLKTEIKISKQKLRVQNTYT
jgi:hypothetical protein